MLKKGKRSLCSGDRSAYFARREAAKVLREVLRGDARGRAAASMKSLVYSSSIRNKRATFALVCQTLKHLPLIKGVLQDSNALNCKWIKQIELMYILTYDILFGPVDSYCGPAEKFLYTQKNALQSALAKLLVRKGVKRVEDLAPPLSSVSRPRYARVNTLKLDVSNALLELGKHTMVQKDNIVPDLLVLPPGFDLHDHPLVLDGSIFLQGKGSSMPAIALGPKPGWLVLDACAAPGNKTVHLASLMRGRGNIIACELNEQRLKTLDKTIQRSGASNIEILHGDFLDLNPVNPCYSKVNAILLDPSCSGSGMAAERMDHLLPGNGDIVDWMRLRKLAAFQKKALAHALSFPAVSRVVYSTCSIHQAENEDVVRAVLPFATSLGFKLGTPFPNWHRRGLSVLEGAEHLVRMDPKEDKEGFFIALFIREKQSESEMNNHHARKLNTRSFCLSNKLSARLLCRYL